MKVGFIAKESESGERRALLVLEDGSVWEGSGFGAEGKASGEVVFNTGMVGYPEAITDPSYKGQILCQTYPLIGNYGVNPSSFESDGPKITAYIVYENCLKPSHNSSSKTLDAWLKESNVPGIYGIDTRALTKKLRVHGVMLGILQNDGNIDIEKLKQEAKGIPDPNRTELVEQVTTKDVIVHKPENGKEKGLKVVLIDCGAKRNIARCLTKRGVEVVQVPASTPIDRIMSYKPDGLMISNGPGDPKMNTKTIESVRAFMEYNIPVFGICLGNQLLALAAGGDTYKLKFGHRSQNQPCLESGTSRCYITSQNHGFAVDVAKLPAGWRPWFTNLNDGTNEGIIHESRPFMSVQFHPEACPGPVDTEFLFDRFIKNMRENK
ncbi:MAG: glutamine-hydrolyzing carbamoyl-phosphate synthase small subunit [Candidatus Aenigmarchaeota archaeon]|nr:glutamine-hydrolyzing carbamoyl-phosphate synthase small subunit [Candidatus Aenigmarchaeota archaeon]